MNHGTPAPGVAWFYRIHIHIFPFLLRSPSTAFSTNRGRFLCTHLWVCESSKVGVKVELYADGGAGQGESSDEQHDQHDVGEGRREVDHLRGHTCRRVKVKKKNDGGPGEDQRVQFQFPPPTFPVDLVPFQMQK